NASPEAVEAARQRSFSLGENFVMSNAWWGDPVVLGRYPEGAEARFGADMYRLTDAEWALVSSPLDFYGFNVYQGTATMPPPRDGYDEYAFQGSPRTSFQWNLTPEALYYCPKFLFERYRLPLIITENGMSNLDWVALDGQVHDPQRIDFLRRYLRELRRATDEGIDILGYTYWSFMDNFEWASGYDIRFGLVYVDYRTQARTVKDAGHWYRGVIESNGAAL
ncbi:MAG: family 1 glycosylhydrolase, partial [Clostridia bacterium]|nr:family 1 glycosylhydrolase [Clostridia bacterium]